MAFFECELAFSGKVQGIMARAVRATGGDHFKMSLVHELIYIRQLITGNFLQ